MAALCTVVVLSIPDLFSRCSVYGSCWSTIAFAKPSPNHSETSCMFYCSSYVICVAQAYFTIFTQYMCKPSGEWCASPSLLCWVVLHMQWHPLVGRCCRYMATSKPQNSWLHCESSNTYRIALMASTHVCAAMWLHWQRCLSILLRLSTLPPTIALHDDGLFNPHYLMSNSFYPYTIYILV